MHKKYVENDFVPAGFEKICVFWKKTLTPLLESVIIKQVRHVRFFEMEGPCVFGIPRRDCQSELRRVSF
mgnify:CR=1 FL=1